MATRKEIIEGLQILEKHDPDTYGVCAEHDIVYGGHGELPLTDEERKRMDDLGWFIDSDSGSWACYV